MKFSPLPYPKSTAKSIPPAPAIGGLTPTEFRAAIRLLKALKKDQISTCNNDECYCWYEKDAWRVSYRGEFSDPNDALDALLGETK